MSDSTPNTKKYSSKYLVAGITLSAALVLSRPFDFIKAYAANQHEWTRQDDLDPLGGRYTSAASSASGDSLLLGVAHGGESSSEPSPLFVSHTYGASWENVADAVDPGIQNNWSSVDVSNNGQTMVAASNWAWDIQENDYVDGKIFISEDGGDNWANITPVSTDEWERVVVSGDGSKIAAINDDNSELYVTESGGDSWSNVLITENDDDLWNLKSVSLSDNGDKLLVGGESGSNNDTKLFISENNGSTWVDISPNPDDDVYFSTSDISADGETIAISTVGYDGSSNDGVFVSENAGDTWTDVTPDEDNLNSWASTSLSDDGSTISVLDESGDLYVSDDTGANWSQEDPGFDGEDINEWVAVDANEDGSQMVVAGEDNVYILGSSVEAEPEVQPTVTLSDPEGGKTIALTTPSGTTITCHSSIKETGLTGRDVAFSYPLGLVDFCFSGADISNEISIVFVTDLKPNQVVVRKYNPNNSQYATVSGATVTETTYNSQHALLVTYNIEDNGPLDTDPDVGEIADPIGLGVSDVGAPNTGLERVDQGAPASLPAILAGVAVTTGLATRRLHRKVISQTNTKD